MKNLYGSMKAVIGFLIIIIFISTFTNEKAGQNTALFILLSMVLLNVDSITSFLEETF